MRGRSAKSGSRDAFEHLEKDHREVDELFRRIERSPRGRRAGLVRELVARLGLHAAIEEQVLYPFARAAVPGTREPVLESLEEHHVQKRTLVELQALAPDDEHVTPKLAVLRESVHRHVAREEKVLFPQVRRRLSSDELDRLSFQLERARAAYSEKRPRRRVAAASPAAASAKSKRKIRAA